MRSTGPDDDCAPILVADPLDLRISLASIVHWADSHEVRVQLMYDVAFPVEDLAMFLVVNQLAHRGAMRPTDLALMLGTGKANLSKIAHRLSAAGLVRRVRSAEDERSVLLVLTPAGRRIGVRIMTQLRQNLDALLASWSPTDVADLQRLLARLAREAIS
ncbi:MAG TPA: MarR family transcriptional regulator [Microlunatus sp.]